MIVGAVRIKMKAGWTKSLKEKRMVVRSVIGKISSRFKVSIAEVEEMDKHQIIVIGISIVGNDERVLESSIDKMISFIEENSEADILDIERELIHF